MDSSPEITITNPDSEVIEQAISAIASLLLAAADEDDVIMSVRQDRRDAVLGALVCPRCQAECHFTETAVMCTNSGSCKYLRRIIKAESLTWRRLVPERFTGSGQELGVAPVFRDCPGQMTLF